MTARVRPPALPRNTGKQLTVLLARLGAGGIGAAGVSDDKRDPRDEFKVSGFKLLKPEQVGGRDTAVIAYQLTYQNKDVLTCTLWVDTGTGLPLKRTLRGEENRQRCTIVENYTNFTLNPQLDAKLFELPK